MAILDNLVGYWKLDEASGTRNDSHGTNHLTDINTVASVAGKVGNAADFEMANSEVLQVADTAALSMGNFDFTIAAWVQLESKPAGDISAFAKGDGSGVEFALDFSLTDRFVFHVFGATGFADGTAIGADTFGMPALATWYFVVCEHNATADTISIQINNGAIDSTGHTFGCFDSAFPFDIGAYSGVGQYWDGLVDEVGVWKRLLTTDERTFLYNGGAGRTYADFVAGQPFVRRFGGVPFAAGRISSRSW